MNTCPDGCPQCVRCGVHMDAWWWTRLGGRCHNCAECKEPSRTLQVWPREFSGERDI